MVRLNDRLDMTKAVDWDLKPQIKQTVYRMTLILICLFVCFVALCFKPTAMSMVGQSVGHPTTLFLDKPEQAVNQCTYFCL